MSLLSPGWRRDGWWLGLRKTSALFLYFSWYRSFFCGWFQDDLCDLPAGKKRTPVLLLPLLAVPYKVQVLYFSKNKYSINSMNVKEVKNILEKSGEGKIIIKIYIF